MEEFERRGQLVPRNIPEMCIYNSGTHSESNQSQQHEDIILDTEIIFARAMTLQYSQRNYDTKNMMAHELAHRPTSIFDIGAYK